jgi:hypothetical protein
MGWDGLGCFDNLGADAGPAFACAANTTAHTTTVHSTLPAPPDV